MIIHGSGPWGHGLDALVLAGQALDITFPVTIEIPDGASQADIEELLSRDQTLLSYEVFILHILVDLV